MSWETVPPIRQIAAAINMQGPIPMVEMRREVGRDVARVEGADEQRAAAHAGLEEPLESARACLGVLLLVEFFLAEVVIAAEVAVGDRAGLVDPAVVHEPTRRLGQPEAGGERDERRDDAGGEHHRHERPPNSTRAYATTTETR